jgi:hypothetical protein
MDYLPIHPRFALPNPKSGKTLDAGVAAMILEFYQNGEHSRQLPGTKIQSVFRRM